MCAYNLVLCITWAPASWTLCFWRPANCISIVLLNITFLFFWQNEVMMMVVWLDKSDDLLKSSVSCITNNALSETQCLQATLPIKDGGLDIRRIVSLALPAFLVSAAGTLQLKTTSLPPLTLVMTPWRSRWSPGGKPHSGHLPPLSRHIDSRHGIDPVFLPRSQM